MKTIEIGVKEHQTYNRFVSDHPLGTIHQLWEWGVFQSKSTNRDHFWVIAIENDAGALVASALLIRQKLPFKKCWLYSPRGPLVDSENPKVLELLFNKIAEISQSQNAVFFRCDPAYEIQQSPAVTNDSAKKEHTKTEQTKEKVQDIFQKFGARPAHAHYQPESTNIIDLTPEPNLILAQMKPKGRYNIKVAKKHGVTVRISDETTEDVKAFYKLMEQTTVRDKFSGHPLSYYQNMLTSLGSKHAKLYLAEYQKKVVAAAIVTYFQKTATYYFGASSNEYRNTMAPYLLHWRIMEDARASGYKNYDLFGIAPEGAKNHPWSSVTEFKLKFGGTRVNYLPAQEMVYQPFWYTLIRIAKFLRGFIR